MTSANTQNRFVKALGRAPFLLHLSFALSCGVGLSFTQSPYDLWPLIFIYFGGFYILYSFAKTKLAAFLIGFCFAIGYFIAGLNWIGNALLVEGNEYRWVWPLAVIALPTLLSLFTALYVTIAHILFDKRSWAGFLGFCALLTVSEWVRGYAFSGFPWNLYGYGITSFYTIDQSLSLIGPYGLTLLTVIWGCGGGFLLLQSPRSSKLIVLLFVLISLAGLSFYGSNRLNDITESKFVADVNLHIVQPNIEQAAKWQPEKLSENFDRLVELSTLDHASETKNIVIWPETALPPIFLKNSAIDQRLYYTLGENSILLSGGLDVDVDTDTGIHQYHNSLMLWRDSLPSQRLYSKSHLVPFGEYIPFQKYIPLPTVTNFSGFQKGGGTQTISLEGFPSFSPLICYEIIFPNKAVDQHSGARPDFILAITNDGWYGDSNGPYQHFSQARFRAIEQGIPVVRSANTGISGVIDSYGRVVEKTRLLESDAVSIGLPTKLPTTVYGKFGDLIFGIMILMGLFLATLQGMKNQETVQP